MASEEAQSVEIIQGELDYCRFPERKDPWGGPLNGQVRRRKLFQDIVKELDPSAIVETGTHRGATTEFFAGSGLPVVSIESDARRFGFACARLRPFGNVLVCKGDSPDMLKSLFGGILAEFRDKTVFFYLDAHWGEDLPLAREIDIVSTMCLRPLS